MDIEDKESWSIPIEGRVSVLEFFPFEWTSQLFAVATDTKIIIFETSFREDDQYADSFTYKIVHQINPGSPVKRIAWSPETSLILTPSVVKMAVASADRNIRLITSSLEDNDTLFLLEGHNDCINDLAYEPEHGAYVASTSDDCTCRIWNSDGSSKCCLTLNSPGVAVCWHQEDAGKIMIAQKNGIIRFYSVEKEQPIMSIESSLTPLMFADWCPANPFLVGAVAGTNYFLWDISKSSQPMESKPIHTEGAIKFLWNRKNPNIFATIGRPKHQIKVMNHKDNQMLVSASLPIGTHLSWHNKFSIVASASDQKIYLYKI